MKEQKVTVTRMDIMREHVFPLVNTINLRGMSTEIGDVFELQFQLISDTARYDIDELKGNLARCCKIWPHSKDCGVDMTVIKKAVDALRDYYQ